jgi:hypothetical protein
MVMQLDCPQESENFQMSEKLILFQQDLFKFGRDSTLNEVINALEEWMMNEQA